MAASMVALANLSPGKDIEAYLHTVATFPLLSAAEEQALAIRFANDCQAAAISLLSAFGSSVSAGAKKS